jgi:hypothetical protein
VRMRVMSCCGERVVGGRRCLTLMLFVQAEMQTVVRVDTSDDEWRWSQRCVVFD